MTARLFAPVLWVGPTPPLDSSPLSREAFLRTEVTAAIEGVTAESKVAGTVEIGYQFGFPIAMPSSFDITMKTPDLSVTGGANAKLAPQVTVGNGSGGGSLGEAGVNTSATATVLPSQEIKFTLNPSAGITDVPVLKADLAWTVFQARYSDIEFHASNVIGQLTIRPYVKFTVETGAGKGSYLLSVYGTPTPV
ncbi:MspA family porin [Nocardia vulneris]|uniref:MspA family porin n=1 Tax=Nocardia vulneris TaxID=1141657 RepID=UPI0030CE64C1